LRPRATNDLDEEMEFHISRIAEELVEAGWTREEAREAALERFGDPGAVREACRREDRGMGMKMAQMIAMARQDVAFAVRQLVRRPLVNSLALVTLVLGVGATAVVFSLVHAVVLRDLPFPDPDRLVRISQTSPRGRPYSMAEPNFVDFQARQRTLEAMAGIGFGRPVLTGDGEAESLEGLRVSHTFFPLLGLEPLVGRTFLAQEDVKGGADQVVVLSESIRERRYGRDPRVLGSMLTLDGISRQVVGIVSSGRAWPRVEVFTPLSPEPVEERDNQIIESIGRLRRGTTIADVQIEMSAIAADLSDSYPDSNDGWGATVRPLRDWLVGQRLSRMGFLLLGAVGLLLLMACVSVTNLRVAQASMRMQEMGVRAALGAGRTRIASQLLIEGAVLGVLGAGIGVALTHRALPLVQALGPTDVGRLNEAAVNGPVLGVAVAAALLTVLVSGLAPAMLLARSGVFDSLKAGSERAGRDGVRLRNTLVVAQFALALTVVVGAGLMIRSFAQLQSVDLGFEPEGMVRFSVRLPDSRFERGERYPQVVRLMDEIEAIPGVVAAGITHAPPFGWMTPSNFVVRSDQEPDRQEDFHPISWRGVAGNYFEANGILLLAGRTFRPEDNVERPPNPPIIIDQALVDVLWPDGQNPIGQLVTWFLPGGRQCEVVGVVGTVRDERVDADPRPRVYWPYGWMSWYEPSVLVRTAGEPAALIPAIRRAALRVDPTVPAMSPGAVRDDLRERIAWPRFTMQVLGAFSIATLILAALGIYGVTAFSVTQRQREIGLRVALGADTNEVLRLVLGRAMKLAAAGIGIGLVMALALSRFMESLLYEVSVTDPMTFVAVSALLGVVALAAAWVPAGRAVRVSPRDAILAE